MSAAEIPVWVEGRCRWVSGVCRKTTCQDVLVAVLRAPAPPDPPEQQHPDRPDPAHAHAAQDAPVALRKIAPMPDPASYVIVERWKGVERRLDGRVRILKVWSAWGDAQRDVQLQVRRVAEKGPASRRHHRAHRSSSRAAAKDHQSSSSGDVERLMRLILAQGETIAGQLRRLREREAQIERLEAEAHRERVAQHGADYVLAAYLQDEKEKGDDSGVLSDPAPAGPAPAACSGAETPKTSRPPGRLGTIRPRQIADEETANFADESDADTEAQAKPALSAASTCPREPEADSEGELRARIALWEKVVKVNKRLECQEERLVRLYVDFRRSTPSNEVAVDDREQLRTALVHLQEEIDDGKKDLDANAVLLTETEALIDAKQRFLRRLHMELEAADMDTKRLLAAQEALQAPLATSTPNTASTCATSHRQASLKSHTTNNDTDSNSDTGLSSLHSSSEEGVYILDTLV